MRKSLWLSVFLCVAFVVSPASANSDSYRLNEEYTVADNSVQVEKTYTADSIVSKTITTKVPVDATNIVVKGASSEPVRQGELLTFATNGRIESVISYNSKSLWKSFSAESGSIVVSTGREKVLIVNHTIKIEAPLSAGVARVTGAELVDSSLFGGTQVFNFENEDGAITRPIIFTLGTTISAEVTTTATLQNDSWFWKTVNIVLPLDTNNQKAYLRSISPQAHKVAVDSDGNIIASFRLNPKQEITVKAVSVIEVSNVVYDLNNDSGFGAIPKEIADDYTGITKIWNKKAFDALDLDAEKLRDQSVIEASEEVFNAVVAYGSDPKSAEEYGSRLSGSTRPDTALTYADYLTASLRSIGIPARVVGGLIVSDGQEPVHHAWVEAYIPDEGWITLDPALEKKGESVFAQPQLQHVAQFIWGVSDDIPKFVNTASEITYAEKVTTQDPVEENALSLNVYALLPGLNIVRTKVQMPAGAIYDDLLVITNGKAQRVGSLAPLQMSNRYSIQVGSSAFETTKASFGVGVDGELVEEFSNKKTSPNYFTIGFSLVFIILSVIGIRKSYKKANAPKKLHVKERNEEFAIERDNLLPAAQSNNDQTQNNKPAQTIDSNQQKPKTNITLK